MQPKLIHLHLPKTGGTSQRFVLYDLYGKDDIFWFGIDDEPKSSFVYEQVAPFRVLGGHKPIDFYPAEFDALYTSVVRDPVSRVASLYSYYAKPEFAHGESSDRQFRKISNCTTTALTPTPACSKTLRDPLEQLIPARGKLSHNLSVAIPPDILPSAVRVLTPVLEQNQAAANSRAFTPALTSSNNCVK
jgi:hypothetical protein